MHKIHLNIKLNIRALKEEMDYVHILLINFSSSRVEDNDKIYMFSVVKL